MITTLAFRHLVVRKLRSLFLLLGFSLGVGVMIVLLSVGEAMLAQSRDVSLVGGGEITVLPQGIDVEAMRTGGLSGMFFGIDRARFLTRQLLGGPRHQALVRVVSPSIEGKLLYLRRHEKVIPVRAGGEMPSRAREVGAGLILRSGHWEDSPDDSAYITPTRQQLYDQLDHFHLPMTQDSSWGEWHYFNLVTSANEWWYITYLIGGALSPDPEKSGRWGGRLLITHRGPNGRYERFSTEVPPQRVAFDTSKADVRLGQSFVEQREGVYHLRALIPSSRLDLDVHLIPAANRYFPPVQLQDESFVSGYVVPALVASGNGKICLRSRCTEFREVPAYHDHNWGVWRNVTWEWGAARGRELSFLYGGVYGPTRTDSVASSAGTSPFFLTVWDSLGVKQVLRFSDVRYQGRRSAAGSPKAQSPTAFAITATRERDSVQLKVRVAEALATDMSTASFRRTFLQMRGEFQLRGRLLGEAVADSGTGFFETYDLH